MKRVSLAVLLLGVWSVQACSCVGGVPGENVQDAGVCVGEACGSGSQGSVSGSSGNAVGQDGGAGTSGAASSSAGSMSTAVDGGAPSSSGERTSSTSVVGSSSTSTASMGASGASASGPSSGTASSGDAASSSSASNTSSAGASSSSGPVMCVDGYVDATNVCVPWTQCTASQFEVSPPSVSMDRVCAPITACTSQEYEFLPPTPTANRMCLQLTNCGANGFEVTPATPTSDRRCAPLTECTAGQFQSQAPTNNSDRHCQDISTCVAGQYEAAPPTADRDRRCETISTCTVDEYEAAPPTPMSNRDCRTLRVCNVLEYETAAPTTTTDRQCSYLTQCNSLFYETVPPTPTTDRECTLLTVCSASQCVARQPTPTTDRQCEALTVVLDPPGPQTLVVTNAATPPTVSFTASACGSPVNAGWTLDAGALGRLSTASGNLSTFTPTGAVGGFVNVIATHKGASSSVRIQVKVVVPPQNGTNSSAAETAQVATTIAPLTQGGGVGGVGGEGLGTTLAAADANLAALQGPPAGDGAAQGLTLLYPYDGTVWPRGMLAPLVQWSWSTGDADGVRMELATTTGSYSWTGYFGRPAILAMLPVANQAFRRMPIPQDIWDAATNSTGGLDSNGQPDRLVLKLTVAKAGVAYGPVSQTWTVASARLTGTIYYQSYGTNLASNYTGAAGTPTAFGAGVLSIRAGDTAPKLVSSDSNCQVCHSVASKGGRLVVQAATNSNSDSWEYQLLATGITSSKLAKGVPSPGYPALSPDGSLMLTSGGALQSLPDNSGADLTTSGLTSVTTNLGVPAFSPDGTKVVFNPQNTVTHPGRVLMVMDFDKATNTFSNPVVVSDDAVTSPALGEVRPAWPQFFPDSRALVYQHQLRAGLDGNSGDAHTRKFARGELYFAPASAGATVVPLKSLNGQRADGSSYLPVLATPSTLACTADSKLVGANAAVVDDGDPVHAHDASYNYEPTVNPVSSGGYAWVVFTSRRMYGNVATIPPFCSDPRGVDLHADMVTNTNITTKKLWVAAVDINPAPGTDGSHPGFYLPAQELLAGNARGFWVLDPCRSDNVSCETGDQCCNGFCQPNGAAGALVCSDRPVDSTCSNIQEACSSTLDCCLPTTECINGFCADVDR